MSTATKLSPVFEDIDKWVKDALARPDSFAMHEGDARMFVTWSLGPVVKHRDSDSIQRANYNALIKALEEDKTLTGWEITGCSHWAVGHVDHLSFRVTCLAKPGDTEYLIPSKPKFKLTRIALFVKQWFDNLSEYPVADEEELSMIEHEDAIETITSQAPSCLRGTETKLKDDLPEDWVSHVHRILDRAGKIDHSSSGAWADEDALRAALEKLDFVKQVD